jgi:hypothetical protein
MLEVRDLFYGEQLVLWTARRWLAYRTGWAHVGAEYALALGCARGRVALEAAEQLLGGLHAQASRTVYLAKLGCCRVSADEARLLGILAALQAGEVLAALRGLDALLPRSAARLALGAAETLAEALAASGHILPRRDDAAPAASFARAHHRTGATLH